jgi:hypothetical protein
MVPKPPGEEHMDKHTDDQTNKPVYAWRVAQQVLEKHVQKIALKRVTSAWLVAQAIIDAHGRITYAEEAPDVARAMAWEDFEMACRGVGQPGISGAIFHIWSRMPRNKDRSFRAALTRAFDTALRATPREALRYPARLRAIHIATLNNGFGHAEASPVGANGSVKRAFHIGENAPWSDPWFEHIFEQGGKEPEEQGKVQASDQDDLAPALNVLIFPTVKGVH